MPSMFAARSRWRACRAPQQLRHESRALRSRALRTACDRFAALRAPGRSSSSFRAGEVARPVAHAQLPDWRARALRQIASSAFWQPSARPSPAAALLRIEGAARSGLRRARPQRSGAPWPGEAEPARDAAPDTRAMPRSASARRAARPAAHGCGVVHLIVTRRVSIASCRRLREARALEDLPQAQHRPLLGATPERAREITFATRHRRRRIAENSPSANRRKPEHLVHDEPGGNFSVIHHDMRVLRVIGVTPLPRNCRRSTIGSSWPRTFARPLIQAFAPGTRVSAPGRPALRASLRARPGTVSPRHAQRDADPFAAGGASSRHLRRSARAPRRSSSQAARTAGRGGL